MGDLEGAEGRQTECFREALKGAFGQFETGEVVDAPAFGNGCDARVGCQV